MTVYRVLLVGFGAAGQGFAQIIRDHGARIAASTGADIKIVGVAAARRGSAYAANGLDAASLLTAIAQGALTTLAKAVSDDALTMIATRDADVLVELSPTRSRQWRARHLATSASGRSGSACGDGRQRYRLAPQGIARPSRPKRTLFADRRHRDGWHAVVAFGLE
jgi:homoserine dehydrogenase